MTDEELLVLWPLLQQPAALLDPEHWHWLGREGESDDRIRYRIRHMSGIPEIIISFDRKNYPRGRKLRELLASRDYKIEGAALE